MTSQRVSIAILLLISLLSSSSDQNLTPSPSASPAPSPPPPPPQCRDRYGVLDPLLFRRRACVMCHQFLFADRPTILVAVPPMFHFVTRRQHQQHHQTNDSSSSPSSSSSSFPPVVFTSGSSPSSASAAAVDILVPDPENATSLDEVCRTLPSADECSRWRHCCSDGAKCCERQVRLRADAGKQTVADDASPSHCPSTWDGYTCWDRTPSATDASNACPVFMPFAIPTQKSIKSCTENGTWLTNQNAEWTDYTPCLDSAGYLTGVHTCVALCVVSLAMLIPAVAIFSLFRDLIRQSRIRLHIHFFVSLIFVNVVNILWYLMVHKELLLRLGDTKSVIQRNPVWCRLLSLLKIYLTSTNYTWMFCEGFHLHRLISNAFEAPSSMLLLYVIGWITPLLSSVVYGTVRAMTKNTSCWSTSVGLSEWIIYVPNFICLFTNLLFLCNILRMLLFQLHAHPHEPSNFRRGLKAGFMLIPLFGIQLLLTVYNPEFDAQGKRAFEILTFVVTNSQGICVSLVFCFFNGEVLAKFRRLMHCATKRDDWLGGASHATHVTVAETKRDDAGAMTTTNFNDVTARLGGKGADDYEAYSDVIQMQDLGVSRVKGQAPGAGYVVLPTMD